VDKGWEEARGTVKRYVLLGLLSSVEYQTKNDKNNVVLKTLETGEGEEANPGRRRNPEASNAK